MLQKEPIYTELISLDRRTQSRNMRTQSQDMRTQRNGCNNLNLGQRADRGIQTYAKTFKWRPPNLKSALSRVWKTDNFTRVWHHLIHTFIPRPKPNNSLSPPGSPTRSCHMADVAWGEVRASSPRETRLYKFLSHIRVEGERDFCRD